MKHQPCIDNFVARSSDRLEIPHQSGYIALENCCLVQSGSHVNKELSKMIEERVKLLNVFILGLCFCLVFTGFITVGQTQVTKCGFGWKQLKGILQALVYSSAENLTASNNQTIFQANGFILQGDS